jgi:hypothetical protein
MPYASRSHRVMIKELMDKGKSKEDAAELIQMWVIGGKIKPMTIIQGHYERCKTLHS